MPNKSIIALWLALLIPTLACTQEVNSQLIEAAKNGETEKVRSADFARVKVTRIGGQ